MMRGIAHVKSYDVKDIPSEMALTLGLECWQSKEPYPRGSSPGLGGS